MLCIKQVIQMELGACGLYIVYKNSHLKSPEEH